MTQHWYSYCKSIGIGKLTISSCVSVRMSRYCARRKFGEHERGVRVADIISVLIKNMKHAGTIKFDYVKILAML